MHRRRLLQGGIATMVALQAGSWFPRWAIARMAASRVRPGMPGWPGEAEWAALNSATNGRLSKVAMPRLDGPDGKSLLANPFAVGDQAGLTQSSGWLDAWRSAPSAYVVAAETTADVAAAVRFAADHNLRLVIKGRGHSYFGASCAPDSLLLWTRRMDTITVHDAFSPAGSGAAAVPAVSVGAGAMWLHAYQAVTGGAGRYVQGGGCTTVGVAGLVQGGGFGSFSKQFGTAAASLLEAEIVTADGSVRTVNAGREPDLFWALKGGGGGSFGVVTRLTLATHPLPDTAGAVSLTLRAHSDEAYRRLLARFIELYADGLCNPHWGEQARARPDNRLEVAMTFQGITKDEARAAFKPLLDFAEASRADYEGQDSFAVAAVPARYFWNGWLYRLFARSAVNFDSRPEASWTDFWWAGDGEQVGTFWQAYTSAWMPVSLLAPEKRQRLVDAWFAASRRWPVAFHFNKGLAGAPAEIIAAVKDSPMNADVVDAFALAIIAASGPPAFDGLPEPNRAAGVDRRERAKEAMAHLRSAAPQTGCYVNECDYFQADWQNAFWGDNYARLLAIKRRVDPDGLFFVHHGVGSEGWSDDGFTRLA